MMLSQMWKPFCEESYVSETYQSDCCGLYFTQTQPGIRQEHDKDPSEIRPATSRRPKGYQAFEISKLLA